LINEGKPNKSSNICLLVTFQEKKRKKEKTLKATKVNKENL